MSTWLTVLFVTILLNLFPLKLEKRKKFILPISFIILFVFLAIRYDYGVDYLTYQRIFYSPELYSRGFGSEPLFWWFFFLFKHYYQFVIAQTFLICGTYFYFVTKYVSPKYYFFFFFVFMCYPGMMFTTIAAMRSSIAVVVFLWGTELFFLQRNKPLLYVVSIFAASLCHLSAIHLLLIPLAYNFLDKMSPKIWAFIIFAGLLVSMTLITQMVGNALDYFSEDTLGDYSKYIGGKFNESSSSYAILRLFVIVPGFYIYRVFIYGHNKNTIAYKISTIAIVYFTINSFGLDFQSRFAVLMFLFVILSISYMFDTKYNMFKKLAISAFVFYVVWYDYIMFVRLKTMIGMQGNFLFYQTIFDLPQLP